MIKAIAISLLVFAAVSSAQAQTEEWRYSAVVKHTRTSHSHVSAPRQRYASAAASSRSDATRDAAIEPSHPSCRSAAFASVPPSQVEEINVLLAQYNHTREQMRRLPAAVPGETAHISLGASFLHVYDGPAPELLAVAQAMLADRIKSITCKLRGLGVNMDIQIQSSISSPLDKP